MRAATVVQVLQDLFYDLWHVLFYLWSLLNGLWHLRYGLRPVLLAEITIDLNRENYWLAEHFLSELGTTPRDQFPAAESWVVSTVAFTIHATSGTPDWLATIVNNNNTNTKDSIYCAVFTVHVINAELHKRPPIPNQTDRFNYDARPADYSWLGIKCPLPRPSSHAWRVHLLYSPRFLQSQMNHFQLIQNYLDRARVKTAESSHISPILKSLYWLK